MGNKCTSFNNELDKQNTDLSSTASTQKHKNSNDNSSTLIDSIKSFSLKETIHHNQNNTWNLNFEFPLYFSNFLPESIFIKLNKLNALVKGYLLRKKFKDNLKTDLMDFANELYFTYIDRVKNPNVSKILLSKEEKNKNKIKKYLSTSWSEFYEKDPTFELIQKINSKKRQLNKLLFEYNDKKFHSDNIDKCIENAKFCYKGGVELMSNLACGEGEIIYNDGRQKSGTFYDNIFTGWNTYINNYGIIYVGLFCNGELNGKGIRYSLENDHIYKGDFVNGLRHGFGKDYRTNSRYEGEFKEDKKCGKGQIMFLSGDEYKGEFKDNKFNGYGRYIWKNGEEYIGNYLDGKFHGEGLHKWGNNQYYKGEFENGIRQGMGEIGLNGKKINVHFINGKPHGFGKYTDEQGNEIKVQFEHGKIVSNE